MIMQGERTTFPIAILIHAGVSEKFRKWDPNDSHIQAALQAAKTGFKLLQQNKTATDAVEAAVNVMENSGATNAGKGSVLQHDGKARMDASLMDANLKVGAVASLREISNPISVCRQIVDGTQEHVFYAHDFVDRFNPVNASKQEKSTHFEEEKPNLGDTVGAVALDYNQFLTAGTSTGGRGNCEAGRIGDSCIIGAGTYCNNQAAVSNTGWGEWVIRLSSAKRTVDLIQEQHLPPQAAVDRVGREFKKANPHTLGTICLDRQGRWGVGIIGTSMAWVLISQYPNQSPIITYGCAKGELFTQQYFE
jgi:beta-aspartyl-peptidase (threonine type)